MGGVLSPYMAACNSAMKMLAQHDKTLFVGQAVKFAGQAMYPSFDGVPEKKRIEMPVAEDFQVGFCTGLALEGFIPVSCFPRWDFLVIAANQLVNHLDKLPMMSAFRPKMIIRTAVGATSPLDPGPQHCQNHSQAFRHMLKTIRVVELRDPKYIVREYERALEEEQSTIMVEFMERYRG